ncbi:RNA polymerase sigma factor [Sphingobacterium pedocola]|uniref:RNA polymerase subunit sigma-70 n=1 Tax=Sphingobacterium pedocola TaxID=2082722 RepID=A0ABR9T7D0_9SPHI|nr:RNA polymerase sigma factor [Sphingobacterium pedocola]MBE8721238.1 RNA polymerase subunit sigma-70 [Sphingobacterium pedocola]
MNVIEIEESKDLLLKLRQGSEPAFNEIYMMYAKTLYQRIFSIVKDSSVTEELLQDLFLKIWQKRDVINPELSFKSFLYTIANNLVYDYMRKVACDKRLVASLMINSVDYYLHTEEAYNVKETNFILTEAINKLSPQQKQVFTLCKIEGKSYKEASQILGITTDTVNSHVVKSSRYIRSYLKENLKLTVAIMIMLSLNP